MKAKATGSSISLTIVLMAQHQQIKMPMGFGFTVRKVSKVITNAGRGCTGIDIGRTKNNSGTTLSSLFQTQKDGEENGDRDTRETIDTCTRRETLTHFLAWSLALELGLQLNIANMEAQAACLPGDTSIDCIGCYKVPIDDAIRNMIDTPENLAKYAPGIRWTPPVEYPKSYKLAKDEIIQLQSNLKQDLIPLVSKGDLTSAGILILKIVPRITVTGRFIISSLTNIQEYSMKAFRVEVAHTELLANLGAADILIGQSFAGQLGSITSAQIQILEELNSASQHYDELIKAIPEAYSE
jgi:hypothetical protein